VLLARDRLERVRVDEVLEGVAGEHRLVLRQAVEQGPERPAVPEQPLALLVTEVGPQSREPQQEQVVPQAPLPPDAVVRQAEGITVRRCVVGVGTGW